MDYEIITWHPECNELHVNLHDLLNDNRMLVLNHPNGIAWSLVTDEGVEYHDDPLSAPYFPIWECLDQDSCKPFFDQIPIEVQTVIKRYRRDSLGIAMMLSQNKFLTKVYGKYSTLFWLAFVHAKSEQMNKALFVDACMEGPFAMLRLCNLPENEDAVELMFKFQAETYGQHQYELIYRFFSELDYQRLNATLKKIPDHLIRFLLQHPECQHLRLLPNLNRYDYPQLVQWISSIQNYAANLEIDDSILQQVSECNGQQKPDTCLGSVSRKFPLEFDRG
jgi:hypothetical protein